MSLGGRLFASVYDAMMSATEAGGLGEQRRNLLADAKGSVLEIGAGTGVNIAHYVDAVDELTVTEPDSAMIHRLERRVRQHAPDALWHERAVARVERRPGASVLYQTGNLKRRPERSLPAKKVLGTRKLDGVEPVVMLRHKARFSSQEHPTEKVRQGDKHGD